MGDGSVELAVPRSKSSRLQALAMSLLLRWAALPRRRAALLLGLAGTSCLAAALVALVYPRGNLRLLFAKVWAAVTRGARPRLASIQWADPTFGTAFNVSYSRSRMEQSWEDFMDGMSLPPHSAIRDHIRNLFARPKLTAQLGELFDMLGGGAKRLERREVERFSRGIKGNVHVLLKKKSRVQLAEATAEDAQWLAEHFGEVFPAERPLDRPTFPPFAKLVLLRRVVRTLMESVGLEQLQEGRGVSQPLVVQIVVDLGGSTRPFRLSTVAPSSMKSETSGASLGCLTESEDEFVKGDD